MTEYLGNYDDYLEKKRMEAAGEYEAQFAGKTKTQIDKEKKKERLTKENAKALRQRYKQTEQDIADTEKEIARLEAVLADPVTYRDPDTAQQTAQAHQQAQEKLEALYELWEELSEQIGD